MEKEKIYCFDFDGTLTTNDTLIEFIRYAKGNRKFFLGFLLYSPLLVLMKLHLYPNWKAKQLIFKHFFGGMSIEKFNRQCQDFSINSQHLLRQDGVRSIQKATKEGHRVFIISASIDNWVCPFFSNRGLYNVTVLGTQIEVIDGKVTGNFKGYNCYGEEKVHRICQALTRTLTNEQGVSTLSFDRTQYFIEAFGDSRGDKELLAFADKGHYKPFREPYPHK